MLVFSCNPKVIHFDNNLKFELNGEDDLHIISSIFRQYVENTFVVGAVVKFSRNGPERRSAICVWRSTT